MGFGIGRRPALPQGAGPVSFRDTGSGDPTLTFHRNGSASASGVVYLHPIEGSTVRRHPKRCAPSPSSAPPARSAATRYRTGSWEAAC